MHELYLLSNSTAQPLIHISLPNNPSTASNLHQIIQIQAAIHTLNAVASKKTLIQEQKEADNDYSSQNNVTEYSVEINNNLYQFFGLAHLNCILCCLTYNSKGANNDNNESNAEITLNSSEFIRFLVYSLLPFYLGPHNNPPSGSESSNKLDETIKSLSVVIENYLHWWKSNETVSPYFFQNFSDIQPNMKSLFETAIIDLINKINNSSSNESNSSVDGAALIHYHPTNSFGSVIYSKFSPPLTNLIIKHLQFYIHADNSTKNKQKITENENQAKNRNFEAIRPKLYTIPIYSSQHQSWRSLLISPYQNTYLALISPLICPGNHAETVLEFIKSAYLQPILHALHYNFNKSQLISFDFAQKLQNFTLNHYNTPNNNAFQLNNVQLLYFCYQNKRDCTEITPVLSEKLMNSDNPSNVMNLFNSLLPSSLSSSKIPDYMEIHRNNYVLSVTNSKIFGCYALYYNPNSSSSAGSNTANNYNSQGSSSNTVESQQSQLIQRIQRVHKEK
jgi:hypothetical protein